MSTVQSGSDDDTDNLQESGAEEPISHGCFADRKLALEEALTEGKVIHNASYIPECTPDGRFKKVVKLKLWYWLVQFKFWSDPMLRFCRLLLVR